MSKENIIQNISQIYTDYEVGEAWGINKSENGSKINQNIDVLLSPTESKHSDIEIEMQNIRSCLII